MKQIIIIGLVAMVFAFSVQEAFIYVCFKINQTNIAEIFCVNKSKPAKNCHGSCFLTKKISDQKEQERKMPLTSAQEKLQVLFLSPLSMLSVDQLFLSTTAINFSYKNESGVLWNDKLLRPPTI